MNDSHKNITQLIERLPLHRQLNETQAMLLKITPIWLRWSASHLASIQSLETNSLETNGLETISSAPIDISADTLKINCFSSVEASHIKHQQASLIKTLQAAGFSNIKRIKVCMSPTQPLSNNLESLRKEPQLSKQPELDEQHQSFKPSSASIQSIESCGQQTDNSQLSESLRRLAATLNKTL